MAGINKRYEPKRDKLKGQSKARHPKCKATGKFKYRSSLSASLAMQKVDALNPQTEKGLTNVYVCDHCGQWHWGHTKR